MSCLVLVFVYFVSFIIAGRLDHTSGVCADHLFLLRSAVGSRVFLLLPSYLCRSGERKLVIVDSGTYIFIMMHLST